MRALSGRAGGARGGCSWGCSWGGASARRWRSRKGAHGSSLATSLATAGDHLGATHGLGAGRVHGVAVPVHLWAGSVLGAARGPGPLGRRSQAGGRSLYEIGRDSGGAAFFGTPPPVPLLGQREGGSRRGGSLRAAARFFCTTFSGGVSMMNRPFCEIPAMQVSGLRTRGARSCVRGNTAADGASKRRGGLDGRRSAGIAGVVHRWLGLGGVRLCCACSGCWPGGGGGWVVRLHRGDLDGAPGRGVGARRFARRSRAQG